MTAFRLKYLSVGAIALLATGTANAAGPCGFRLPVDSPTTLSKVARACQVTVSQLREANPGVNPGNVRPGEHLAIPAPGDIRAPQPYVAPVSNDISDDYDDSEIGSASYWDEPDRKNSGVSNQEHRVFDGRTTHEVRDYGRDDYRSSNIVRVSAGSNDYRRDEYQYQSERYSRGDLALRDGSMADRLSFQELSALRIQQAGRSAPRSSVRLVSYTPTQDHVRLQTIECARFENQYGAPIKEIRSVVSSDVRTRLEISTAPDGSSHCRAVLVDDAGSSVHNDRSVSRGSEIQEELEFVNDDGRTGDYRLPDYSKIGPLRSAPVETEDFVEPVNLNAENGLTTDEFDLGFLNDDTIAGKTLSLSGDVVTAQGQCLILVTPTGRQWQLAAGADARDLVGKQVTVWGALASTSDCGQDIALRVDQAIYAERVR